MSGQVKCDGCGKVAEHYDRLDYRLEHKGAFGQCLVVDFCSKACIAQWVLGTLTKENAALRKSLEEARDEARGKRR